MTLTPTDLQRLKEMPTIWKEHPNSGVFFTHRPHASFNPYAIVPRADFDSLIEAAEQNETIQKRVALYGKMNSNQFNQILALTADLDAARGRATTYETALKYLHESTAPDGCMADAAVHGYISAALSPALAAKGAADAGA